MWFVSRWHILQLAYFQNSLALLFSNCSAQIRAVPRRFAQFRADSRSFSRRFARPRSSAHSRRIVIASAFKFRVRSCRLVMLCAKII